MYNLIKTKLPPILHINSLQKTDYGNDVSGYPERLAHVYKAFFSIAY